MNGTMPASPSTSGPTPPRLRFFHASGHASARAELERLIQSGTQSFQAAVCYFTKPGLILLRRHASHLCQPGSFFVASVDSPTNLDALAELYHHAPDHVFIHLGGQTPKERKVGRALMHSKVFLARGTQDAELWVGSHNLTGQGIEGGNIEAGVHVVARADDPVIMDAATHLEVCRSTAELFDPSQMERYRQIQEEHMAIPPWVTRQPLLILHAEAAAPPTNSTFTVHVQIVPTDFDEDFQMDGAARLFIHRQGALQRGIPADMSHATLWTGTITAVVRTARHPKKPGTRGTFPGADFDIDIPSVTCVPELVAGGASKIPATSQIILRIAGPLPPGEEIYSLDEAPVKSLFLADDAGQDLHDVDQEMAGSFTPESMRDGKLIYRAVRGVKQEIKVAGYKETMRTDAPALGNAEDGQLDMIVFDEKQPKRALDVFFYKSKYTLRPRERKP